MPGATLRKLRAPLPRTEAVPDVRPDRGIPLDVSCRPSEVDRRPDSIGKAIPNAEILVVRPDGTPCAPDEPGELVHRGVARRARLLERPAKTAERFKPAPGQTSGLVLPEIAVWSGDTVRADEEGYLYFIGRRDEMIKTSGYRVSPTEVEEVVYASGLVADAVAVGVPHPTLGQASSSSSSPLPDRQPDERRAARRPASTLPTYMVPAHIDWRESLPRNPNGKYDRPALAAQLRSSCSSGEAS